MKDSLSDLPELSVKGVPLRVVAWPPILIQITITNNSTNLSLREGETSFVCSTGLKALRAKMLNTESYVLVATCLLKIAPILGLFCPI